MKLADRIAAWFGYVPAEHYAQLAERLSSVCRQRSNWDPSSGKCPFEHCEGTFTTVKPRPHIIVSADFKRGIPCS